MTNDSKWAEAPIPLTGLPAFRRWLTCKLGQHSRTSEEWDTADEGRIRRRTLVAAWCGDCGRPLKGAERARCDECGQPISHRQPPVERQGVEW
jgi:hypothetical protein